MTQFDEEAFNRIFSEENETIQSASTPTAPLTEKGCMEDELEWPTESLGKNDYTDEETEYYAVNQRDEALAQELGEEFDGYMDDACRSEEEGWYYSDED